MSDDELAAIRNTMNESMRVGTRRYGTPLQTFNGRDTLKDAIDEARDLFVYLSALDQARAADRETLIEAVERGIQTADKDRQEQGQSAFGLRQLAEISVDSILDAVGPVGPPSDE